MALSPVAAGILPAVEPGVPPGGLVGTQAETTSARPRWALLRHDRAASCRYLALGPSIGGSVEMRPIREEPPVWACRASALMEKM